MNESILTIKNMTIQMYTPNGIVQPVEKLSLNLKRGEVFTLVGESGCGKTMTALGISRLLPHHAYLCEKSEISLEGVPLHRLSENEMRKIRNKKMAMIFQDPAAALNPVLTIEKQLYEAFPYEETYALSSQREEKLIALLEKVHLPEPKEVLQAYPHQLSGGMKQRVMIAMALAKSPSLLIADEPTTALDVTTQAQVLNLLKDLKKQYNLSILLITHDLGIVKSMSDRVGVMYAGHLIEQARVAEFFRSPFHPYTAQLFDCLPEKAESKGKLRSIPGMVPSLNRDFKLCRFKDRCVFLFSACESKKPVWLSQSDAHYVRCHWYDEKIIHSIPIQLKQRFDQTLSTMRSVKTEINVKQEKLENPDVEKACVLSVQNLAVHFPIRKGFFRKIKGYVKAVDGVSFTIEEGETLALVGESGSGKTTLGKAILRLIDATHGKVFFYQDDLSMLSYSKLKRYRDKLQMVFQDPYASMNPRMQIQGIIEEGMRTFDIGSDKAERKDRVMHLLHQVGLPLSFQERYPHELSGGQRQRVAIARALAVGAQLIVCDEPTSALDLSVQAQILNLLKGLQEALVLSYLFITHNIGVVQYLADTIAIMYLGRIVEIGPAQRILKTPKHPYTQALLSALPRVEGENREMQSIQGDIPSSLHPPTGCHFASRCPHVHALCLERYPESIQLDQKHFVKCYLYN